MTMKKDERSLAMKLNEFIDGLCFKPSDGSNTSAIAIRYAMLKEVEKRCETGAKALKEEVLGALPVGEVFTGSGVSVSIMERKMPRRIDRERTTAFLAKKLKLTVEKASALVDEQCSSGGDGVSIVVNTKVVL